MHGCCLSMPGTIHRSTGPITIRTRARTMALETQTPCLGPEVTAILHTSAAAARLVRKRKTPIRRLHNCRSSACASLHCVAQAILLPKQWSHPSKPEGTTKPAKSYSSTMLPWSLSPHGLHVHPPPLLTTPPPVPVLFPPREQEAGC